MALVAGIPSEAERLRDLREIVEVMLDAFEHHPEVHQTVMGDDGTCSLCWAIRAARGVLAREERYRAARR